MNKLFEIQQKLKVAKEQFNSFGGYKFRSAEDILTALKPLCAATKTCILINDILENIGERYYVRAAVDLIDVETGKTIAKTVGFAREEEFKKGMDGSQITGASSSYARKYALNAMFMIDDVKDSDITNTHQKENKQQEEELKCPECGGKITTQALQKWGKCSQCKQKEVKGDK